MRKVLITGAGGFIGSHLAELCVERGYTVRGFVHYNSLNQCGWLDESRVRDEIDCVAGDIRDYDSIAKALRGCDTIFHLAALIGIPYSYESPLAYIRTNVEGTYNVLQASKEMDLNQVIVTSTSETYGTAQYVPIDEDHPLNAQSPYAASKVAADQLSLSFFRSFELPVKIARPFNTFGPRQSARAIIPSIIIQILSGQKEIRLGNLTPTRDFTYVDDTAVGFLEIAKTEKLLGQVVNIGSQQEMAIADLVHLIAELMNESVQVVRDGSRVRPSASEVERLLCQSSKLMKTTDWTPVTDLNTGLLKTIAWFENHLHRYKAEVYSV